MLRRPWSEPAPRDTPAAWSAKPAPAALVAEDLKRHWLVCCPGAADDPLLERITTFGEFRASLVQTMSEAVSLLTSFVSPFDGAILDAGPAHTEGAQLCKHLRRSAVTVPLLIVGEWSNLDAVVRALESGADDFIPRSCPAGLLAARMRSHLRTFDACEHATFPVGNLRLHPSGRALVDPVHSRRVRLTVPETKLLQRLLDAKGAAVARDVLAECAWGRTVANTRTLDANMDRLRHKIRTMDGSIVPARLGLSNYRLAAAPVR